MAKDKRNRAPKIAQEQAVAEMKEKIMKNAKAMVLMDLATKAANEPLLPLWRTVRAAWAAEAAINRGPDGTDADEGEDGPALRAYRAAAGAFDKVKPTTTLGLFLTLLNSDAGDDFADEHPAAVDAIIAQLQAANVSLRSLAKKGGRRPPH